ncbi:MAG: hypothetical protein BWY75_02655 [bacterium ADurb.Bin425]|nr:MAG: hypothetical protein BWY75_02655 [bacterium ADurb.Bin425]
MTSHLGQVDAEIFQNAGGNAFAFSNQTKQKMLGTNVVVTELPGFIPGQLQNSFSTRSKWNLNSDKAGTSADYLFHFHPGVFQIDSHRFQGLGSYAGAFTDEPKKNLLRAHKIVTKPARFFLREHNDLDRLLREPFKHWSKPPGI